MNDRAIALAIFVAWSVGCAVAGYVYGVRDQSAEPAYREAVSTAPNDVALEVTPGAKPKLPAPSRPHGGKVVSTTEVTVSGGKPVMRDDPAVKECLTTADFECPAVSLRMDMINVDGNDYMAVYGDDGVEVTGRFIPYRKASAVRKQRIVATYSEDLKQVTYLRDYGRLSVGPTVMDLDGRMSAGVSLGLSW